MAEKDQMAAAIRRAEKGLTDALHLAKEIGNEQAVIELEEAKAHLEEFKKAIFEARGY